MSQKLCVVIWSMRFFHVMGILFTADARASLGSNLLCSYLHCCSACTLHCCAVQFYHKQCNFSGELL